MNYLDEDHWYLSLEIPGNFKKNIKYYYGVRKEDGLIVYDGEEGRQTGALPKADGSHLTLIDTWVDEGNPNNIYYTKAFQKLFPPSKSPQKLIKPTAATHEFRVKAPLLKPHETICLLGSTTHLNSWDTSKVIPMVQQDNWFTVSVQMNENEWPASYKYGIYDTLKKELLTLEAGENRLLLNGSDEAEKIIIHDGYVNHTEARFRGAGINIPVFSLRTQKSFGTGEFTDLRPLIDWASLTGIKLIQLLPINDTSATNTWKDSYPYAATSSFALHPLYINLEKVAGKKDAAIIKSLRKKQKQLNELDQVDYEQVIRFKISTLRELYDLQKNTLKEDKNFTAYFKANKHWLVPYAAYSYLKEKYQTADFSQWKLHSQYNQEAILKFTSTSTRHYQKIEFYYFVQYHLHCQLKEISDYAKHKKIVLKGDIPIGIYRYSCDAWVAPSLYNIDQQAGAPPDDFAVKGQNWGFPTYNWELMKKDGFSWWHKRFDSLSNYFDAFRIDHILGFFRIWSIPIHSVEGIMGRFVPARAIDIAEFGQRNIPFDHKRFCLPYITHEMVESVFGNQADEVKERFLCAGEDNRYNLRTEWDTQQKIKEGLSAEEFTRLGNKLFDLVSNVLAFEEEGSNGQRFHLRIGMPDTISYQELNSSLKDPLYHLYLDYYYHRQDFLWTKEAMEKLPQLKRSTQMLVCGEDLGMVPHCVPEVMQQLGILGLEVERMPKSHGQEFFHPKDATYLSIVTPGTHDMSTLREWWTENKPKTQKFYNNMLGHYGEAPETCEPWIAAEIIGQHLYSPAIWSIFLLQDIFALKAGMGSPNPADERINIPAHADFYWRYRMPISLEQLIRDTEFNTTLKELISKSGR